MSVTAVPLQPVKRSYIWLLWIGIAAAVIAAFLLARQGDDFYSSTQRVWGVQTTASGLKYKVIEPGKGGKHPTDTDVALIQYEGRDSSGKTFDKSQQPTPMPVKGVVQGFSEAIKLMSKGEKARIWIPSALAYGASEQKDQQGKVVIKANSNLVFDIELVDFLPQSVIEQYQKQMQQMQGGGAGGMGGPGGPGAPGGPGGPPQGGGESLVPPPGQ
jgi:FKBP-type peptidyl-prolyl cis-trans isomerase FkpA